MALTSVYLAEEALALPPAQREELAKLLLDSLKSDGRLHSEQPRTRGALGNRSEAQRR